jgi:hypothetical protein
MIQTDNRRRESRHAAREPVTMVVEAPLPCEITGTLMDRSPTGFRARYESPELQRGDRLHFRCKDGEGSAVVIWTRIVGLTIEAGFRILN